MPVNGWPTRGLSEILTASPGLLEWRLLATALRGLLTEPKMVATGSRRQRPTEPVRTPQRPLLLINPPHTPHLPEATDAPVFIVRPLSAAAQSLAAPLRVLRSRGARRGGHALKPVPSSCSYRVKVAATSADNLSRIGLICAAATSTTTEARSSPNFLPLRSLAMIASVASTAPTVRPSTEDIAAKQRLEAAKQAQAQQATSAASSTEEPAAFVSISKQGAAQATARSGSTQAAADSTPKSNKPALAFEAADTDQDSKISTFEQKSYDFRHPAALKAYTELAATPSSKTTAPKDEAETTPGAFTGKPTETPGPV